MRVDRKQQEHWPDWLRDIWGPEPEGPRRRAEDIARNQERARLAEEWRRSQQQENGNA
jgi:hypothetical protein